MSWQRIVKELDELTADTMETAWKVAVRLRRLVKGDESTAYLQQGCGGSKGEQKGKLIIYAGRFGCSPLEMVQMIERRPRKAQWTKSRLDVLRAEVGREIIGQQQVSGKAAPAKRKSASIKELETTQKELREAKKLIAQLQTELAHANRQIAGLRGRITRINGGKRKAA